MGFRGQSHETSQTDAIQRGRASQRAHQQTLGTLQALLVATYGYQNITVES